MSLFKEKDDIIKFAFKQFGDDSESEECEMDSELDRVSDCQVDGKLNCKEDCEVTGEVIDKVDDEVECVVDCDDDSDEPISVSSTKQAPDVIDISSDEDDILDVTPQKPSRVLQQHNTSIEDHDFTLKFTMAGKYQKCQTNYGSSFAEALKSILDDLNTKGKSLKLFSKDQEVSLEETPKSLGLRPGSILQAIEVPLHSEPVERVEDLLVEDGDSPDSNALTIKLQDGNRKHTKDIRIVKSEPLCKLKSVYATTFSLESTENIKLFFDGDEIDDESTAEDLELEDGFAVDVVVT